MLVKAVVVFAKEEENRGMATEYIRTSRRTG